MRVWRIASQSLGYSAKDLSGTGAKITGGRWNSMGIPVLYCAESPSLACVETLVHLGTSDLPLQRYLVAIDIPDRIWKTREILEKETLPINWNICPPSKSSIDFGNAWIKSEKSVLMSLPSVIVPEDSIFIINPLHKDSSLINASVVRKWEYDIRLFS